jgi:hypothetical protein
VRTFLKFFSLPAPERRLTMAAAARLVWSRLLLSTIGLRRTQERVVIGGTRLDRGEAEHVASVVNRVASHLPIRTNCLDRAIALAWLLSRRGLAADLRIGVRKDGASIGAHAWIEHDGVVLLDGEAEHYLPLDVQVAASRGR